MAFDPPTPAQFKTRFPIFGDTDDERVQIFLTEAARTVDETWIEEDFQPAIMYLAAHLLATDNSDEGSTVQLGGAKGALSSESFSGMSRSYDTAKVSAAANSTYGSTEYGRRFYTLLQNNHPAVLVV